MEYENLPKYRLTDVVGLVMFLVGAFALALNIAIVVYALGVGYGGKETLLITGTDVPAAAAHILGAIPSIGMMVFGQLLMIAARVATEQVKQTICLEHLVKRNG